MRNLNADQLQTLIAVIDLGGFTHAARSLHLTQPAVSLQIRELELRCGVSLIDRQGNRPTAAGQDLYVRAKHILGEHDAALGSMRRHRDGAAGRVRIGMSTTTLIHVAGPTLRRVKAAHSTLQVIVEVGTSPELAAAVHSNDLDIAIVTLPVDLQGLRATPLFDDDLVAILPDTTPGIPDTVTPDYLAARGMIIDERQATLRTMTKQWFEAAGREPEVVMALEHLEAIKGAVAAGLGSAIVPRVLVRTVPHGIVVRPLSPGVVRRIALVEPDTATAPDTLKTLKQALLDAEKKPAREPPAP